MELESVISRGALWLTAETGGRRARPPGYRPPRYLPRGVRPAAGDHQMARSSSAISSGPAGRGFAFAPARAPISTATSGRSSHGTP